MRAGCRVMRVSVWGFVVCVCSARCHVCPRTPPLRRCPLDEHPPSRFVLAPAPTRDRAMETSAERPSFGARVCKTWRSCLRSGRGQFVAGGLPSGPLASAQCPPPPNPSPTPSQGVWLGVPDVCPAGLMARHLARCSGSTAPAPAQKPRSLPGSPAPTRPPPRAFLGSLAPASPAPSSRAAPPSHLRNHPIFGGPFSFARGHT